MWPQHGMCSTAYVCILLNLKVDCFFLRRFSSFPWVKPYSFKCHTDNLRPLLKDRVRCNAEVWPPDIWFTNSIWNLTGPHVINLPVYTWLVTSHHTVALSNEQHSCIRLSACKCVLNRHRHKQGVAKSEFLGFVPRHDSDLKHLENKSCCQFQTKEFDMPPALIKLCQLV